MEPATYEDVSSPVREKKKSPPSRILSNLKKLGKSKKKLGINSERGVDSTSSLEGDAPAAKGTRFSVVRSKLYKSIDRAKKGAVTDREKPSRRSMSLDDLKSIENQSSGHVGSMDANNDAEEPVSFVRFTNEAEVQHPETPVPQSSDRNWQPRMVESSNSSGKMSVGEAQETEMKDIKKEPSAVKSEIEPDVEDEYEAQREEELKSYVNYTEEDVQEKANEVAMMDFPSDKMIDAGIEETVTASLTPPEAPEPEKTVEEKATEEIEESIEIKDRDIDLKDLVPEADAVVAVEDPVEEEAKPKEEEAAPVLEELQVDPVLEQPQVDPVLEGADPLKPKRSNRKRNRIIRTASIATVVIGVLIIVAKNKH